MGLVGEKLGLGHITGPCALRGIPDGIAFQQRIGGDDFGEGAGHERASNLLYDWRMIGV